jgi:hypothetical protein
MSAPPDPPRLDGRLKTFGSAFEGDVFDVGTLKDGQVVNLDLASHGIQRMARFYEAAAAVLTPDQRAKYAQHLRDHAGQEEGR